MFASSIAHNAADLHRHDLLAAADRDRLVQIARRSAQAARRAPGTHRGRERRARLLRRLIPILHH